MRKVKQYRQLMSENKIKNVSLEIKFNQEVEHLKKIQMDDEDFEKYDRRNNMFDELVLHEGKHCENYKIDDPDTVIQENSNPNKLNSYYTKISSVTSLNDLFEQSAEILKEVLNCTNIIFLMKDKQIISIFNEEGKGYGTSVYVDDKFFVIAHYNKRFNK